MVMVTVPYLSRRPSPEGRGLKLKHGPVRGAVGQSPLTRGAWIETSMTAQAAIAEGSRPSPEGRGLKLHAARGAGEALGRPSPEGRGLKRLRVDDPHGGPVSPLTRGAWIETASPRRRGALCSVAPHPRGVD